MTDNKTESSSTHIESIRGAINKGQIKKSYKKTLARVQSELPIGSRLLSKFLHNPLVELVSDIVSSSVARANAMLAGSIVAFSVTLIVYITSQTLDYELSGLETAFAFVCGWALGIVYDYLKLLLTGKKY
jgi:hypothetical protein